MAINTFPIATRTVDIDLLTSAEANAQTALAKAGEASASATLSQAYATGTAPGGPGTLSAREEADRAEAAAAVALSGSPYRLPTFADLSRLTYGVATGDQITVVAGDTVDVPGLGVYRVAASSAPDTHVTTAGGVKLRIPNDAVFVTPEMFGALGDGVSLDHYNFLAMSQYVRDRGCGIIILRPGAEYVVFDQTINTSAGQPYYNAAGSPLSFFGCNGVLVIGDGAVLKTQPGLRYGAFDPVTGEPFNAAPGGFTNPAFAAQIGTLVSTSGASNVTLQNVVGDGNSANLVVGGYFGDVGIQLDHTGIRTDGAIKTRITGGSMNDFGLDGLYASGPAGFDLGLVVDGFTSLRNGRQGFSWVGGRNVNCRACNFSETGRGAISSSPGAGLDLEDNGQGVSDGYFENCTFSDNAGPSVLCLNDTANILFRGGVMHNRASGRALWPNSPDLRFDSVAIFGNVINVHHETVFNNCFFSNESKFGQTGVALLMDVVNGTFNGGTIECHKGDALNINVRGAAKMIGTKVKFKATDPKPQTRVAICNALLRDVDFIDEYTFTGATTTDTNGDHTFVDATSSTTQGETAISGNHLAWNSRLGLRNGKPGANFIGQASYLSDQVFTLSGSSPFDIPIGVGNNIVMLYKGDGNTTLRNVAVVLIQSSNISSAPSLHQVVKLTERSGDLGGGGSISVALVGNADVIRLTQGSIPLAGESFRVRKIALTGAGLLT